METVFTCSKARLGHKKEWYFLNPDGSIERKAKNNIDILEILENDNANAILLCEIVFVNDTDGTQIVVPQYIHRKDIEYMKWTGKIQLFKHHW